VVWTLGDYKTGLTEDELIAQSKMQAANTRRFIPQVIKSGASLTVQPLAQAHPRDVQSR
jgi:hypothetical protein